MIDAIPANIDVERSVIGGMLTDETQIDAVIEFLRPEDFFRSTHQDICRTIYEMRTRGEPIDAITLENRLQARGMLARVGGIEAIHGFVNAVPHALNTTEHARIVERYAVSRELIERSQQIIALASSPDLTGEELTSRAESLIFGVSDGRHESNVKYAAVEVPLAVDRVEAQLREDSGSTGETLRAHGT